MPKRSRTSNSSNKSTKKRTYGPKKGIRRPAKGNPYSYGRFPTSRGNFVVSMPRNLPLPKTFKTMFRYCEKNVAVNPAAGGAVGSYIFSANGLYDPNISGVGHQPLGFDQFMLMYEHATVIGSKIELHWFNPNADLSIVGCYLDNDTTVSVDAEQIIENAKGTYAYLSDDNGTSKNQCVMRLGCNPPKFLGLSKGEAALRNSNGSNPSEQVYFVLWGASPGTGDPGALNCMVVIDYIVELHEPKELQKS